LHAEIKIPWKYILVEHIREEIQVLRSIEY
jgi:hypothetical protein